MSVIDLGHWFPSRGNDAYPTFTSVAGPEPPDTWNGIFSTPDEMAQFQWLAKEITLTVSGTAASGSYSDTIVVDLGRGLYTSYTDLWDNFVATETDYRITASQVLTIEVGGIEYPLYFALGAIWLVGTEADVPLLTMNHPICQEASWQLFTIPCSFQAASSGGDTTNPNVDDPADIGTEKIGRFAFSAGGPVGHDLSFGFNIVAQRSNRGLQFTSLDVTATVTSWLTLPAV